MKKLSYTETKTFILEEGLKIHKINSEALKVLREFLDKQKLVAKSFCAFEYSSYDIESIEIIGVASNHIAVKYECVVYDIDEDETFFITKFLHVTKD